MVWVGSESKNVSLFMQYQLRGELHFESTFGYLAMEEIMRSGMHRLFQRETSLGWFSP